MTTPDSSPADIATRIEHALADPALREALAFAEADAARALNEQIAITAIPAPTFRETRRGEFVRNLMNEAGLEDVRTDEIGNVLGVRRGARPGPTIMVSAHLDTVFPEGTDTTPQRRNGRVYAPGIADDGRGLAALLSLARALHPDRLRLRGECVFCATVGEEGLGDLRGVKHVFATRADLAGFLSIEPGTPARTTARATGSKRYRIVFKGPGGHSYGSFGKPSAIHALGRAVARIADLAVPDEPKTTFTVGTVSGGTSVNTIAAEAAFLLDMRSTDLAALADLETRALQAARNAADDENRRWNAEGIAVDIEKVGDRPAGSQPDDAPIVLAAMASAQALGIEPKSPDAGSTDSNVPISLGIPAVTLGGGGKAGGVHTLGEWHDPTDAHVGVQRLLLLLALLAGLPNQQNGLLAPET